MGTLLKYFIEDNLPGIKIFCDTILHEKNIHQRYLLLYKTCPFQNIPFEELNEYLESFGTNDIGIFIFSLAHFLNYTDDELDEIYNVIINSEFKYYIKAFLSDGLHVRKRFQNCLINDNNIGINAEIYAYNYEKNKLIKAGRFDLANNMMWPSRYIGDIFGYDILSHTLDNKEKLIEVKGTEKEKDIFKLSFNEWQLFSNHDIIYYVYYVILTNGVLYEITQKDNVISDQFGNEYEKKDSKIIRKK